MWGKKKKQAEHNCMCPATYAEALIQAKTNANKHANENLQLKAEISKLTGQLNTMKAKIEHIKKKLQEVVNE